MMFDLNKEWSVSFAGCGFMGIYYVGATSCILERFPRLIEEASQICGASAGALMAAVLTIGFPLDKSCAALMSMAKEARKHNLGPLHPTYNLLQIVQDSLLTNLPEDAHVRASGKLCVSLTRVSDGKNVLVSEFDTRDELVQVLICSCFIPFYCGVFPPSYRGVRYMDGAISDNLPRSYQKNTLTLCAFAGESDICPRGSALSFHEVRFNNVSIQLNMENIHRVANTFFPPGPEVMAEICQSGYTDALRFLQENNLIKSEGPMGSLETDAPKLACCELARKQPEAAETSNNEELNAPIPRKDEHWWLDPQITEMLPVGLRKVFCEECKETHSAVSLLSQVTGFLRYPYHLPVGSALALPQRLLQWARVAGDRYRKAWKNKDVESERPLHRSTSLPSHLNLGSEREDDRDNRPLTPEATPNSSYTFDWDTAVESDHLPLTPPSTPTFSCSSSGLGEAVALPPPGADGVRGLDLDQAAGLIQNVASEQTAVTKKTD